MKLVYPNSDNRWEEEISAEEYQRCADWLKGWGQAQAQVVPDGQFC